MPNFPTYVDYHHLRYVLTQDMYLAKLSIHNIINLCGVFTDFMSAGRVKC